MRNVVKCDDLIFLDLIFLDLIFLDLIFLDQLFFRAEASSIRPDRFIPEGNATLWPDPVITLTFAGLTWILTGRISPVQIDRESQRAEAPRKISLN